VENKFRVAARFLHYLKDNLVYKNLSLYVWEYVKATTSRLREIRAAEQHRKHLKIATQYLTMEILTVSV